MTTTPQIFEAVVVEKRVTSFADLPQESRTVGAVREVQLLPCIVVAGLTVAIGTAIYVGLTRLVNFSSCSYAELFLLAAIPVIVLVTAGTTLLHIGRYQSGTICLTLGLLVALSPVFLIGLSPRLIPLSREDRQGVVVAEVNGKRVISHPHLGFSFRVAEGMRENPDLERYAKKTQSNYVHTYVFTREEMAARDRRTVLGRAIVTCAVSQPLMSPPNQLHVIADGYVEGIRMRATIESIEQSGRGLDFDVRMTTVTEGRREHVRVVATVAEDGRPHMVMLTECGLSDAETRDTLDSLTVRREPQ